MERRLAAILAADVVGYSRLMGVDEEGTLAALKVRRHDILQPMVAKHHGRVVKVMGDGALVEFASAVNAVQCALDLQQAMAAANRDLPNDRHIVLRVGVNLGDVMLEGSDLYGDGVNIAARLEAIADPGGIVISSTTHDYVRNKVKATFDDMGAQTLKNIAEPIRAYRVAWTNAVPASAPKPMTEKPTIAVLPFTNMSGDPEQEYFSDGITEDIITDLSKVSALSVIARNTVFAFKGKVAVISKIAEQLSVSHVLEGSVRKAGGRVRISAQLIDGKVGDHIWAERYDRDLNDIFALQDEISQAIVTALKVKLMPAEKKAIETRSTYNREAFELYFLARHHFAQYSVKNFEIAVRFCQRALEIDPSYARAWALLAICQARLRARGKSNESGLLAAERALVLDPNLADAHAAKGAVLTRLGRYNEALAAHEESVRIEPDSYDIRFEIGQICFYLGHHEAAIEHYERAAELLETDFLSLCNVTMNYEALGRHEEYIAALRRVLERVEREIALHPDNAQALSHGAIALASLGEKDRAKQWAMRAQAIEPDDPSIQYNLGCALARMNEPERALDILESCVPKWAPEYINWVKKDPDLIPLHDHPLYRDLIARAEARLAAHETKPGGD